ncbi:MAG: hypothetical protein ACYDC6_00185 [Acidobacteriaceae bacterium]
MLPVPIARHGPLRRAFELLRLWHHCHTAMDQRLYSGGRWHLSGLSALALSCLVVLPQCNHGHAYAQRNGLNGSPAAQMLANSIAQGPRALQSGDEAAAETAFRRALSLAPTSAEMAHFVLGTAYSMLGQSAAAGRERKICGQPGAQQHAQPIRSPAPVR